MGIIASDDFSAYSDGDSLQAQANWFSSHYSAVIYDGGVVKGLNNNPTIRSDVSADDYAVQAVLDITNDPGGQSFYAGVVARYEDNGNFVYAWIRTEDGFTYYAQVRKRVGGQDSPIAQVYPITTQNRNTIRMEVSGSTLTVDLNDSPLGTGSWDLGTDLQTGAPGIHTTGGSTTSGYARLDDFLVESLDSGPVNFDESISLSGGGDLDLAERVGFTDSLACSGGGDLAVDARVGYTATLALSGGGETSVVARVGFSENLTLSGGGDLGIEALVGFMETISLSGGGDVVLTFDGDEASILRIVRLVGRRRLNVALTGDRQLNVQRVGKRQLVVTLKGKIGG